VTRQPLARRRGSVDALPAHAVATRSVVGAGAVLRPGVNLWIWRRERVALLEETAARVAAAGPFSVRAPVGLAERADRVEALLEERGVAPSAGRVLLARDMAALAFLLGRLGRVEAVRVRIDAGRGEPCPLFHVDAMRLRLLCTYTGAGTQWLPDEAVERTQLGLQGRPVTEANAAIARDAGAVQQLRAGWAAILKGARFGGGAAGLVHRSPPAGGSPRLLLCVDLPGDGA